jgi:hypothetical protein
MRGRLLRPRDAHLHEEKSDGVKFNFHKIAIGKKSGGDFLFMIFRIETMRAKKLLSFFRSADFFAC